MNVHRKGKDKVTKKNGRQEGGRYLEKGL